VTSCGWAREVMPIKPSKADTAGTKRQVLDVNEAFENNCFSSGDIRRQFQAEVTPGQ